MQQQLVDGTNALKIDFFDSIGIQLIPEVESFRSGMMPKNQILETFKRIDKGRRRRDSSSVRGGDR